MTHPTPFYSTIIVGGGHAGCEAAAAAARTGANTLLITQNLDQIGQMSCNPAIGGIGKGHLVREVDALGGIMGQATDYAGIQFRLLNRSKGPAVWGPRAQVDKVRYRQRIRTLLESTPHLHLIQDEVCELTIVNHQVTGVITALHGAIATAAVVLTTGTFLNGLIHLGEQQSPAGRLGDPPALPLANSLRQLGLAIRRMKTGTPPRLDGRSIDFNSLEPQEGDPEPVHFSFLTARGCFHPQLVPCHITRTTPATIAVIQRNLHQSALYGGRIHGVGPRYCPSIEDKVVKFPHNLTHQIFLEPEGGFGFEVYPNGLSTSLPLAVQVEYMRSIPGLEQVRILKPGYAIEYDMVDPTQLDAHLAVKGLDNLYLAGQINGTTGYEEAAAQGLVAGLNAALASSGKPRVSFSRSRSYLGVMIDDLITRGVDEPYRMFTSRAEQRINLRIDNADLRLTPLAIQLGLSDGARRSFFESKLVWLSRYTGEQLIRLIPDSPLSTNRVSRETFLAHLHQVAGEGLATLEVVGFNSASDHHTEVHPAPATTDLASGGPIQSDSQSAPSAEMDSVAQVEDFIRAEAVYFGYRDRLQLEESRISTEAENLPLPNNLDWNSIPGLSIELAEKLRRINPTTVGQAYRIPGMTPAAITTLMIHVKRGREHHE